MTYPERSITGERIVITGATNGIGTEIARALARRGAQLTLLARDEAKARDVAERLAHEPGAQTTPEVVVADLADLGSVHGAAAEIADRYDHVHVLVNNAGVHSFAAHRTFDGFERMTATNYLGPFLLTNLLLDLLRAAAPSRIVNTASEAHRMAGRIDLASVGAPRDFGVVGSERIYAQSKLMDILFTQELARRLDGGGVTVNCFCPGVVSTGLVRDRRALSRFTGILSRTALVRRPDQGARLGIRLILDPGLAGTTGKFFTATPGLRYVPPVRARSESAHQHALWDRTAELVGLGTQ